MVQEVEVKMAGFCVGIQGVLVFCLCTICMPGDHRGLKRASDPLDLELDSSEPPCGC